MTSERSAVINESPRRHELFAIVASASCPILDFKSFHFFRDFFTGSKSGDDVRSTSYPRLHHRAQLNAGGSKFDLAKATAAAAPW
jgi:hypothetical protein